MTLHSSKGLEFPWCAVGWNKGSSPATARWMIPPHWRRSGGFAVGITRAKELFLSHASERRLWGGMRNQQCHRSFWLNCPRLVQGDIPRSGGAALRRSNGLSGSRAWIG